MFQQAKVGLFKNVSFKESQCLVLGSFSVMLYSSIALSMHEYDVGDVCIKLLYGIAVLLFPWVLLLLNKQLFPKESISKPVSTVFLINLLLVALLSLSAIIAPLRQYYIVFHVFIAALYLGVFLFKDAVFNCVNRLLHSTSCERGVVVAISVTLCLGFFGSLYMPFMPESILFIKKFFQENSVGLSVGLSSTLLMGAALMIWVFFFSKTPSKNYSRFTFFLCFSPILLLDVLNTFDIEHYNAFLGPATAVLHGKIPLVEVFCQYGLCYLVFTVAYLVFPQNYAVASLVVSVLNVMSWVMLLLILRKMIRNPWYFTLIALSQVLGSFYVVVHVPNILPSTVSMRYFPTLLLTCFILLQMDSEDNGRSRITLFKINAFTAIALLNVLWSVESLVSFCIIYGSYVWLIEDSKKTIAHQAMQLVLFVLSIYAFFSICYLVFFGNIPNYLMYIEYIYAYINPYKKSGWTFLSVGSDIYQRFTFWMFFAVMHLVTLFLLFNCRLVKEEIALPVKRMLLLNVVGIVFMLYFVLQPSFYSIINSGYPSFILLFSILAYISENANRYAFVLCAKTILLLLTFLFFFMFVKNLYIKHKNFYKNTDLLYSVVHNRASFNGFFYNLNHFCSNRPVSPGAGKNLAVEENTCRKNAYHQELHHLIGKWFADKEWVLLFHRNAIEALMAHNKGNKIFVNPVNDSIVGESMDKTLRWGEGNIQEHDILIVEKNLDVMPIEYRVLTRLVDRFNFLLLEETDHLWVFELTSKRETEKTDLRLPLQFKEARASFSYIPNFNGNETKLGAGALFDHDKGTIWAVGGEIIKSINLFWVWIDLGALTEIEKIKLWRRIDFRKPDYASTDAFNFAHHFNLELSQDNKTWELICSEQNLEIGNQYFYEADMHKNRARYIRLNVFVDDIKQFSISEIEVFGKK